MRGLRRIAIASMLGASLVAHGLVAIAQAGGQGAGVELTAFVDGRPIPLSSVSRYYCDDFSYPIIQCSSSAVLVEVRATAFQLLAAIDYVTIYDKMSYQGPYMHISQDYAALITIGWNDRIGSFRGRNGETGRFSTDWFYGGSWWSFCCNQTTSSLGSYDNTFSSVQRT